MQRYGLLIKATGSYRSEVTSFITQYSSQRHSFETVVTLTIVWLYRSSIPKQLALIPVENKFAIELSSISHGKVATLQINRNSL